MHDYPTELPFQAVFLSPEAAFLRGSYSRLYRVRLLKQAINGDRVLFGWAVSNASPCTVNDKVPGG